LIILYFFQDGMLHVLLYQWAKFSRFSPPIFVKMLNPYSIMKKVSFWSLFCYVWDQSCPSILNPKNILNPHIRWKQNLLY